MCGQVTLNLHDHLAAYVPKHPGAYLRFSSDRFGLEAGVDRQLEDAQDAQVRLHRGPFTKIYRENDTSAFEKRKVIKPDGSIDWIVLCPELASRALGRQHLCERQGALLLPVGRSRESVCQPSRMKPSRTSQSFATSCGSSPSTSTRAFSRWASAPVSRLVIGARRSAMAGYFLMVALFISGAAL
ncbi:hypothetical protein Spla01_06917 [Streptomyces platensis]|uniref:Uncharacterized protein n=1 Tax=Streptomyces platensis TaxID=58346 RepID=A0ABX3Y374_STRPT|nr:hypothetical protein BG653_01217 [Streptomyces platensis]